MLQHRGFPRREPTGLVCALSLAPSRAPCGRERERARDGRPASTARRPARSKRSAGYARLCPARCAGPCPGRLSPRTRAAVWRATAQAAPSAGTRKPARGATDGDTRWRRGHMHFSPERARAVRRAPARPEWSVASDAEGGSGERGGPYRTTGQPGPTVSDTADILADSERARPPRSSPDPASTTGTRSAAWGAGCRAAEGFHETRLSRLPARSTSEGSRQPSCQFEHHRNCAYRGSPWLSETDSAQRAHDG